MSGGPPPQPMELHMALKAPLRLLEVRDSQVILDGCELDFSAVGKPPRVLSVAATSELALQGAQAGDLLVGAVGMSGRELRSAGSVADAATILAESTSLRLKRHLSRPGGQADAALVKGKTAAAPPAFTKGGMSCGAGPGPAAAAAAFRSGPAAEGAFAPVGAQPCGQEGLKLATSKASSAKGTGKGSFPPFAGADGPCSPGGLQATSVTSKGMPLSKMMALPAKEAAHAAPAFGKMAAPAFGKVPAPPALSGGNSLPVPAHKAAAAGSPDAAQSVPNDKPSIGMSKAGMTQSPPAKASDDGRNPLDDFFNDRPKNSPSDQQQSRPGPPGASPSGGFTPLKLDGAQAAGAAMPPSAMMLPAMMAPLMMPAAPTMPPAPTAPQASAQPFVPVQRLGLQPSGGNSGGGLPTGMEPFAKGAPSKAGSQEAIAFKAPFPTLKLPGGPEASAPTPAALPFAPLQPGMATAAGTEAVTAATGPAAAQLPPWRAAQLPAATPDLQRQLPSSVPAAVSAGSTGPPVGMAAPCGAGPPSSAAPPGAAAPELPPWRASQRASVQAPAAGVPFKASAMPPPAAGSPSAPGKGEAVDGVSPAEAGKLLMGIFGDSAVESTPSETAKPCA